jgi:hypothetical protein
LKIGVEAQGLIKYLYLVNWTVVSNVPTLESKNHFTGSELDNSGYRKLSTAVGGGLYSTGVFGRFMPKFGVGYLMDLNDVYDGGIVNYRFDHFYVSLAFGYLLHQPRVAERSNQTGEL